MIYKTVKIIEFEVTTTCNSFCPVCMRFRQDEQGVWLNRLVDFNKHLSVKNMTKILSDSCVDDDVQIDFIGTVGDPLAHPNFNELINKVNPRRKLQFEFSVIPNGNILKKLTSKYNFILDDTFLHAELPDQEITNLVSELFQLGTPASITLEDLPVEDTMRSFFINPEKFLI